MRILFLSRLFYPHIGGVEKHVLEVSKLLIKKGHKVTVVAEQDSSNDKLNEAIKGINVFRIPNLRDGKLKKFKIWKWLFCNYNLIRNADVVHCHDVFFWYLPFRFLFPLKKIFTTFHGYEGNFIPSLKAIAVHKISEKLSFGNICVGSYLGKWYGTRPTVVTYGAARADALNINFKERILGRAKINIVYVGRLEEEAGIMDYLEAVKILIEKKYSIGLTVLGDGSQRPMAEDFSKKNNLKVVFKGFQKNVDDFLLKADHVFTSRYLGTLEAMAKKKFPFVVWNNNIKKDAFEMSPFVDYISLSSNARELASEFIYHINNKKNLNKKILAGFYWVRGETWEKLVANYLALWGK